MFPMYFGRWGERYDGHGGSMKYTDKWAERCEGGDVVGREAWRAVNRTWGEGHNGSGWVHKYGKSSSGGALGYTCEQDTWYERFPHYGFYHCFENSVQLREVQTPPQLS
ncbi:hypothetical protein CK203_102831 [Vitis vinifera]|uniref:Uncharacterized protein n=1 Tax=Vitis vinifera TaxID=29760 RepID=A0A438F6M0_VITVI|nr:hypothetical protein CK203_102831 [Vitis vinifera]